MIPTRPEALPCPAHAFPSSLIPILLSLSYSLPGLLSGPETIHRTPGLTDSLLSWCAQPGTPPTCNFSSKAAPQERSHTGITPRPSTLLISESMHLQIWWDRRLSPLTVCELSVGRNRSVLLITSPSIQYLHVAGP